MIAQQRMPYVYGSPDSFTTEQLEALRAYLEACPHVARHGRIPTVKLVNEAIDWFNWRVATR